MNIQKYLQGLEDLSGKEILITGGTSGIGLSIVKHLLSKNAIVTVLARNMEKAISVKSLLLKDYPSALISFIKYDQSDDESVINASKEIANNHRDFYALILNAGLIQERKKITYTDGYCTTIKANYIGAALLLKHLLPRLEGNHRIIFQGSLCAGLHIKKTKTLKETKLGMFEQYFISKAGIESLFYHCTNMQCNCTFYLVEPGIAGTDIIRDFVTPIRQMGRIFLKVASHSPDKAALTAMKALQTDTRPNSFIVPRGLFATMGYPKFKKFPRHRQREYLFNLLEIE